MASRRQHSINPRSSFSLLMFEEDFINICSLVSKVPNHETGGNLFGLWTNEGNAVVLVATGPGKNCTRSETCFYQDIPYMARVGQVLTQQYPLCHIGEWHSHHHLQLYEPSSGDCKTIRRNYPTGSQGFVLMIANFTLDGRIQLSPYKFTDDVSPFQVGKIEVFNTKNPFNDVPMISYEINIGREEKEPQDEMSSYSSRERDRAERGRPRQDSNDRKSQSRSRSPQKRQTATAEELTDRNHCPSVTQDTLLYMPIPPLEPPTHAPKKTMQCRVLFPQNTSTQQGMHEAKNIHTESGISQPADNLPHVRTNVTTTPDHCQRRGETSSGNYCTSSTHNAHPRQPKVLYIKSTASRNGNDCERISHRDQTRLKVTSTNRYGISDKNNRQQISTVQDFYGAVNRNGRSRRESSPYRNGISNTHNTSQRSTNPLVSNSHPVRNYSNQLSPPMSNTTPQWYDVDKEVLRDMMSFMKTLSDDANVGIKRDTDTHEVSFHFKHNHTQWIIYFPKMFPRKGYVECSDVHFGKTKKIELTGNFNDFKYKLKNVIYRWH